VQIGHKKAARNDPCRYKILKQKEGFNSMSEVIILYWC